VSLIYGRANTGKTTLSSLLACEYMKAKHNILYINTENVNNFREILFSRINDIGHKDFSLTTAQDYYVNDLPSYVNNWIERNIESRNCVVIVDCLNNGDSLLLTDNVISKARYKKFISSLNEVLLAHEGDSRVNFILVGNAARHFKLCFYDLKEKLNSSRFFDAIDEGTKKNNASLFIELEKKDNKIFSNCMNIDTWENIQVTMEIKDIF